MGKATIGEQELALLRHVADVGDATVGEVADSFGAARGLARSTVLTVMERLRRKGWVSRRLSGGVYRYKARASSAALLRDVVERFVDGPLGGSVAPFVAYLSEARDVSDAELAELEALVERLSAERGERGKL